VLIARGEFSVVLASLGVAAGIQPQLGPLAAAFILISALVGPILAHVIEPMGGALMARRRHRSGAKA
jgi:CPA2 family monovalent cation:H+ antiporter-2